MIKKNECNGCVYEEIAFGEEPCENCTVANWLTKDGRTLKYNFKAKVEHDGCDGCRNEERMEDEFPCKVCAGTHKFHEDKFPDLYVKKEGKDNVNHPSHYGTGKFECIDVMIETQGVESIKAFCICNAFKYLYRHDNKNGLEDIRKAVWYLNKFIELEEGE